MRFALPFVMIAACGGPKQAPPGELHPTLEAAPIDAPHRDASDDVNAVARQLGAIAAPAKPTIPRSLRVPLYVRDLEGLLLLDDEQTAAASMVATWARNEGLSVEDPARTRVLIDHAKRGENAVTGKACGAPLWQPTAVARWRRELAARGRIEARVQCTPACWLGVTLALGVDPGLPDTGPPVLFAAPYDVTKPWRTELPRALARLADADGPTPVVANATEPLAVPDESFDVRDHPLLGLELRDRVEHCVPAGQSAGVVVELDVQGAVAHCNGDDRHVAGDLAAAPCACKELAGQVFSDAKGRRRGFAVFTGKRIVTTTRRGVRVGVKLHEDEVSDPSIAEWAPDRLISVEHCFGTESDPQPFEAAVTLEFDQDGTATKATVSGAKLAAPVQKCVEAALATIRAPCPAVAKSSAQGHLAVTFDKP
ncbi:MAG TPA: hypothetical protein VFQ65_19275 [Kofleriaceae bacterium]|nr:hypothetical protein [Kofleriaceae bacterium]